MLTVPSLDASHDELLHLMEQSLNAFEKRPIIETARDVRLSACLAFDFARSQLLMPKLPTELAQRFVKPIDIQKFKSLLQRCVGALEKEELQQGEGQIVRLSASVKRYIVLLGVYDKHGQEGLRATIQKEAEAVLARV